MKNILLAASIMSLFLLNACNQQGVDYDTSLPTAHPIAFPDTTNINSAVQQMETPASVTSNNAENSLVLNPEHGQSGHRCDIAVGAPLNSSAQKIQPTSTPQPTQNILTNTGGAVTLNPPHGQPGHDCAIPVGQPLKG